MGPRVLCFGEVLWDCLPTGRLPGGAPLNVTYHLHRLGCDAHIVSAVGSDALGDEMLAYLASRGLSTAFIRRHPTLPTGTVEVALGPDGQPSYTICTDVAWDEIASVPEEMAAAVAGGSSGGPATGAIVYGSLAARSEANRAALDALLAVPGPLRVMDVNLRAPFDDIDRVFSLARRADWIKLNDQELTQLTDVPADDGAGPWPANLENALAWFSVMTGCARICVTCGALGAVLFHNGAMFTAKARPVQVRDTIGAGDAFTAALVHGLLTTPALENLPAIARRACALGGLVASLAGGQPDYDVASMG